MRNLSRSYRRWTFLAVLGALLGTSVAAAQTPELPLGSAMPMSDRALARAGGGQATLAELAGERGTAVVFWSNQCPWVDKYEQRLLSLAREFEAQGISVVLVNANDASAFPQESQERSQQRARAAGYTMPYLVDTGSQLARAFGAERTPHVFVFDANRTVVYVGTVDDSPGDPANARENYLRDALSAVAQGESVAVPKTKAFGCMIKFQE